MGSGCLGQPGKDILGVREQGLRVGAAWGPGSSLGGPATALTPPPRLGRQTLPPRPGPRAPGSPDFPPPTPAGCNCESDFTDGTCEDLTGRCYCRPNFTGARCDACADGFTGFPHCHREREAGVGAGRGPGPEPPSISAAGSDPGCGGGGRGHPFVLPALRWCRENPRLGAKPTGLTGAVSSSAVSSFSNDTGEQVLPAGQIVSKCL